MNPPMAERLSFYSVLKDLGWPAGSPRSRSAPDTLLRHQTDEDRHQNRLMEVNRWPKRMQQYVIKTILLWRATLTTQQAQPWGREDAGAPNCSAVFLFLLQRIREWLSGSLNNQTFGISCQSTRWQAASNSALGYFVTFALSIDFKETKMILLDVSVGTKYCGTTNEARRNKKCDVIFLELGDRHVV